MDKVARTVVVEKLQVTKADFPTLPNRGDDYAAALQASLSANLRSISLDRLEASLAAAGIKPVPVQVQNDPPQVVVSQSPAILVPVNGAPVWRQAGNSRFQRVINTSALILKGGLGDKLYMHVYDGWLEASAIEGPWTLSNVQPLGMDDLAQKLAKSGQVDMLDGGPKANPKPSLANGVPQIVVSQVPTELIVFRGQPDFVPISGTQLLWAANTTADVFVATGNNNYYVLMSGRWFSAPGLNGPWTFTCLRALPADFARIRQPRMPAPCCPPSPARRGLSLDLEFDPQTATVPLKGGPSRPASTAHRSTRRSPARR